MTDKTPTELIAELNNGINKLENLITQQVNILEINKSKMQKLIDMKKALLNYLNEDYED